MPELSFDQKQVLAQIARAPLVRQLMGLVIRFVVARHRVGVALVAIDDEGRILMLRHVFHPAAPWGLPGGWLGRSETPAQCALRELKEETGLIAELGPIVSVSRDSVLEHISICYVGQIKPGPVSLSGEILQSAWFRPNELPPALKANVLETIEAAMAVHRTWLAAEMNYHE